ncbi:ArsR/SmtB family transcription factor [Chitinimonas sp. BJB300]|uniref:ArsR/SmtB family transcription factor n=1 Tax=Chitinimonas sp. BJB300 TaxID=1559339 RepID=UPI000C0CF885|nr:metalloregulator ArsR/SmtB family transcription factor [Chitinimonas sp. BJB300]PHV10071.1 transcriptional regulator [Chitinimonas sp. BJB300]TSJ83276.1 winged helix-turn-helix transcriptional regulator [Chitinimonas sp. BJB300]
MENKAAVTLLAALAQETRLAIFRLLVVQGVQGMTVGKIGDKLDIPPATLSFHLKELTRANLIDARQEGRFIHYSANYETMGGLLSFMTENCCSAATMANQEVSGCS